MTLFGRFGSSNALVPILHTPDPLLPAFVIIHQTQLMADKMRLYAGDEDVDLEELERALTIVRRKMTDPESFPGFLENPEVRASPTRKLNFL